MRLTVEQITVACGGRYFGKPEQLSAEISGITTDSREAKPGCLFAAIVGSNNDGHEFIGKAFENGAVCCLSEREPGEDDARAAAQLIVVPSTLKALRDIAAYYRTLFSIPVVGVTGSVGKTTVKEMIAAVLSQRFNVLKTEKNLNNELGVPLTLFRLNAEHEAAVIEMGISDFGEMRRLSEMVRPDMAVFTVIGDAHLEFLGSRIGVLKAKAEILENMPESGKVFINGGDSLQVSLACVQTKIRYGTDESCDVRAENIKIPGVGGMTCDIVYKNRRIPVRIPAYGEHLISAALAACAVGITMGLDDEELAEGIAAYQPVAGRSDIIETRYCRIIDDSYNANPTSVAAAVTSLRNMPGRRVCILGDMRELGADSLEMHRETGKFAAASDADCIIACGVDALGIFQGAKSAGANAEYFPEKETLIAALSGLIRKNDTVLVKASRGMKFEDIVEALEKLA